VEELTEKFKKNREEYKMKIGKLVDLFDEGLLPNTPFVDSFIPRVVAKFKLNLIPLTTREQEVIDEFFEKY
jgi:hypothetical protein